MADTNAALHVTRAILADVPIGNNAVCPGCGIEVRYNSRKNPERVMCNVYIGAKWDRYEEWHARCYTRAGHPNGAPVRRPKE